MIKELEPSNSSNVLDLENIQIFSPFATADDSFILKKTDGTTIIIIKVEEKYR